jgi:hypothetical protein
MQRIQRRKRPSLMARNHIIRRNPSGEGQKQWLAMLEVEIERSIGATAASYRTKSFHT